MGRSEEFLEFAPNVVNEVRKLYDLDKPGAMEAAVDILDDWIKKQNHFLKKDFDRYYLETAIITTKGSIEKAKMRIDKQCTLRTLIPNYFGDFNVKTDFKGLEFLIGGVLPKQSKNFERVYVLKNIGSTFENELFINFYRKIIITAEYLRMHDYVDGFHIIFDISEISAVELGTSMNPVELRKILTILMEGYGMRIRGIHFISKSKALDIVMKLIKAAVSEKIGGRLHSHDDHTALFKIIPKEILPKDYGGDSISLSKLNDKWNDLLTTPENLKFLKEMSEAKTDESRRLTNKFNEDYLGMPGSFRKLAVD